MEKQQRQQHHPDGRRVQQDRGDGQCHHADGREVAGGKEENTAKSQSEKEGNILDTDPEAASIFDQQYEGKRQGGHSQADADDLDRSKACQGGETADKDAHAAPENAGKYNQKCSICLVRSIHSMFPFGLQRVRADGSSVCSLFKSLSL